MTAALKAIEATGVLDERGNLALDEPVVARGPARVRVILLFDAADDAEEREWLRAAAANPAFVFLADPAEDVYTPEDGKPFDDAG